MTKPEYFDSKVWDELPERDKKEIYLDDIITQPNAPQYLAGMINNSDASLDTKIKVAEKILAGATLTLLEEKAIGFEIND